MLSKAFSWLFIGSLITAVLAIIIEFIESNSVSVGEFMFIMLVAIVSFAFSDKDYIVRKINNLFEHE